MSDNQDHDFMIRLVAYTLNSCKRLWNTNWMPFLAGAVIGGLLMNKLSPSAVVISFMVTLVAWVFIDVYYSFKSD